MKLGKNEYKSRIQMQNTTIGLMHVLREHLAKDIGDADKLQAIADFANFWYESAEQERTSLENSYDFYYSDNGKE